ncbi:MAG: NAD(P)-dependent alcohol dehydrogenase [Sciscionella sp.]
MDNQRVAVLTDIGHIAVERRAIPRPGEGQVLVAVSAVSVCGSDVHYFQHGRIGDFIVGDPLVLGHEASGVVAACGPGVTEPAVGRRVAIEPQSTCGRCEQCLRGRYNLCRQVRFFATPPVDGAFAEYVVVDAIRAHPVPDALSDEAAALIEPLSVAVHACEKAGVQPGSRVLISGAGPVGLLCLQVALARGATAVTVTDINTSRLAVAARFGADTTVDAAEAPPSGEQHTQVDVVLECTGVAEAIAASVRRTAPAATVVLIGMGGALRLPLDLVQARELWLTGIFRYAHAYPAAIALAASGKVALDELITSHHDLDGVSDALLAAGRDPAALKAVVHPGAAV